MIISNRWYQIAETTSFPTNGVIQITLGESEVTFFAKCDHSGALISLMSFSIIPEHFVEIRLQKDANKYSVDIRLVTEEDALQINETVLIISGSNWLKVGPSETILNNVIITLGEITGEGGTGESGGYDANKFFYYDNILKRVITQYDLSTIKDFFAKNIAAEKVASDEIDCSDLSAQDIVTTSIASDNFASNGFLGSGYKLSKDAEGKTKLEVDELLVRQSATFYELIIQQAKHQGGIVFYTAASMECISVTEQADSYRCFFDTKDGQIPNEWAVNDQARCQRFAGKYYWRLVTAVGTDYIDLSKADTNGAGVPEKGDIIVQLGNRTDTARQAAKVTTVIGADAPRDEFYEGINSFDLTGKLITIVGMKDGKAGIYTTNGEFSGKVNIGAGSSGLSGLSEWAAAAQDIEAAQSTANQAVQSAASLQSFIDNTLPAELSSLQAQIDGQVESWDFPYVPTLSNYPASEWTTDALKDRHIHDTFYNNQPFVDNTTTPDAGKAWRFTKSGGTYFWNPISDSDAVKALALAAQAQDTADGKRRVFVTTPTTPYDIGDLWTQGSGGDIMRCINQRLSGAYVAGDWEKAVKYTDDTAVNSLQIGGRNLLLNSKSYYLTQSDYPANVNLENGKITVLNDGAWNCYNVWMPFVSGLQYRGRTFTVSLDVKISWFNVNNIRFWLNFREPQINAQDFLITYPQFLTEWQRISCTVTLPADYTELPNGLVGFGGVGLYNTIIEYRNIKCEYGDKPTDWTPAPEDVEQLIQDQQIYVEYSVNGSTDWHTTFTTGDLYMRQKKGSGDWSAAIRIVGEKGEAGSEGRYIDYQFAKNTSATTAPTSGWQDAPPAITAGEYVWMRVGEVIPPATSPASWSTAVRITGDKGPQGVPGTPGADGVTYYTWIRYADTSAGAGISNDPTGKLYIGFAYNKTTPSESNTPSDYSWSLIKGEQGNQGVQGPPGANGVTTYTWIKYSDNADGTGLYDTPTANTKYIGIAVNKTTASESSEKTDYVWSLFKGADGKSITGVDVEFAQSASATTAPTSGWQTTAPAWVDGQYIWTRTKTTYSDASSTYSAAVNLTGAKGTTGNTGATGTGIDSITEEYYLSTSKTEQTGGEWSTTPPTWSTGKYVWTRVKIVYKNPASTVYTTAVVSSEWEAVNDLQIGGTNLFIYKNIGSYLGGNINDLESFYSRDKYKITATNQPLSSYLPGVQFQTLGQIKFKLSGKSSLTSIVSYFLCYDSSGAVTQQQANTGVIVTNGRFEISITVPAGTAKVNIGIGSISVANYWIDEIKIESGDKATAFSLSLEDVQAEIDAAKAKALELDYLKTALAGTTEIQNGLVLTRMMLLKNALEQVTAGISGLTTNDLFLFANDSDALNAALNDIATFSLKRNGMGNLGNLRFTRDGMAYCPRLANGKLGAPIIEFRSTPIPPLSDLVASFTTSVNGVGGSDNKTGGVKTGNFGYSSAITVSAYDNFSMRVQGLLEASINNAGDKPIIDSHAAVNIVLYKYAGGVYTQERVVASLYIMHDVAGSLSDSISVDETFMLAKGTYYLRAEYYLNTTLSSLDSAQISASSLVMTASGASGQKMMIFGSNGFVRIKDGTNYTYMSDEMMAHRGVFDVQGVRGSGSVASNGVMSNAFGKATGASRSSNGIYVVNHSVGHTNYGVNLTIISSNAQLNAVVTAKNNTSFEVKIVNASNNALSDSAFDFSMYANV